MPARSHRTSGHRATAYAQVCKLSTQQERAAASAMVERLDDAGWSYSVAAAAVRASSGRRGLSGADDPKRSRPCVADV